MSKGPVADRRDFLKTPLLVGVATVLSPAAVAQSAEKKKIKPPLGPTTGQIEAETGPVPLGADEPEIVDPGSDFMVDLMKAVDIDYVAAMAGSTFRGLHESIVTYGGNRKPELIACVHEEISAAMCHGYAKVALKPMACMVHSNVGLQHASMAIYNAYCDRVPMVVIAGNLLDAANRRPWIEWLHSQTDLAAMVRDFIKWDDVPVSIQSYGESFMRAYEMSMTPPYGPVLIVADGDLQEHAIDPGSKPHAPKRAPVSAPAGEQQAIDKVAATLVAAESPVIVVDRLARTPAGMEMLVRLAELVNAPVIDRGGRLNMPTDHYLNHSFRQRELVAGADAIVALEVADMFGFLNSMLDQSVRTVYPAASEKAKVVAISASYGFMRGNVQDLQRYVAADLTLASDGEACLPQLIASVQRQLTSERRKVISVRAAPLRAAFRKMRADAAEEAANGWDLSPVSTGRMCMEIWEQIKDLDWALVSGAMHRWPQRLWDMNKHHQYIGGDGAGGIGYGLPAAAGAALAHRDAGRISIDIQTDGDFMMLPGTLWTLAHHSIPLLMVMHNNRAWHQEVMHLQRMSSRRNRGVTNAHIGTTIGNPDIDYAQMARSMGVWAEGPISDPEKLKPAITRALAEVKAGRPALIDVVSQPR